MKDEASFSKLARAKVSHTHVIVFLDDGREVATPLSWYPKLSQASDTALQNFEVSPFGLHWPDLDEDLSIRGMLAGRAAVHSGDAKRTYAEAQPVERMSTVDLDTIAWSNSHVDVVLSTADCD